MSEEMEMPPEIREAQDRIKEQRAELERLNAVTATRSEEEPAAEPQDPSVPESDSAKDLSKDIEELKRDFSRRSGEYGSELDKLRKSLQVANDNNAMLIKQMEMFKSKKKSRSEDEEEEDDWETRKLKIAKKIPSNQREAYDDESIDVMARVGESAAKQVLKQQGPKYVEKHIDKLLEEKYGEKLRELDELKQRFNKVEASAATTEFADAVDVLAPGFKYVNGSENKPADENWVKFLDSPKDEFNTWREWCEMIKGPKAAAYVFKEYQKTLKPVVNPADQVAGQISPSKSQAASSSPSDGQKRVLSLADYQRFQGEFYAGKYADEPQKAVQIMETFTAAAREGRLK